MTKKKSKPKPPFLIPGVGRKRRSNNTGQLESWFRSYPALRIAYREVKRRFDKNDNICGIGIGRKYSESKNKYLVASKSTGGLCIKVFVEQKIKKIDRNIRIPAWINVSLPGTEKKKRVLLDVVSVGGEDTKQPVLAELHDSNDRQPQFGKLSPGRLFAFKEIINSNPVIKLGTTGALIRYQDGSYFGISASHVFTNPCLDRYNRPEGVCALGTQSNEWKSVKSKAFHPPNTKTNDCVRDVMLFPAPVDFIPDNVVWPDDFLKELATQDDIDHAVVAETATGFIWVDREGHKPKKIPVDLDSGIPKLKIPIRCGTQRREMFYIMSWPMRFITDDMKTVKGDSGSPVFLSTKDNTKCRLLGIHFLEFRNYAYAMDVKSFFREILRSKPNKDVWFA